MELRIVSQSPCLVCGSASCRFSFPKTGTVPPGDCPHFRGRDRVPSPVSGLRKLGSRFLVSQADENPASRVVLEIASELPLQTTSTVPLRVAVTTALPLALHVEQRLAARITLQAPFRLSRQGTSLVAAKVDPQTPAGKASELAFRTTPGTVPGTVPKVTREAWFSATCEQTVLITCSETTTYEERPEEDGDSLTNGASWCA